MGTEPSISKLSSCKRKNDINVVSFLKDYKNDTNKGNPVSPMSDIRGNPPERGAAGGGAAGGAAPPEEQRRGNVKIKRYGTQ